MTVCTRSSWTIDGSGWLDGGMPPFYQSESFPSNLIEYQVPGRHRHVLFILLTTYTSLVVYFRYCNRVDRNNVFL